MQPGDVYQTFADVSELVKDFDYKLFHKYRRGVGEFLQTGIGNGRIGKKETGILERTLLQSP